MWAVLLMPDVPRQPGKTGRLYASLEVSHYTKGQMTDRLVALLTRGGEVSSANLFNVFENVADDSFDGLGDYRKRFLKDGADSIHLAGSGPALFTLIKARAQAEKIYDNLQKQGLKSYLTETLEATQLLP
jgi:4-diphosphocytidyl-2-C-methyl-D-erythritol kinase